MKIKAVVGSVIIAMMCSSMAVAQWPGQTYGCNNWEIEAGTRIMERQGADQSIALVTDAITNQTLFNTNTATDLEMSAGADVRLLHTTCQQTQWEIRGYFNRWDTENRVVGNLNSPLFGPGVDFVQLDYGYDSDLFSIECNWKKAVVPGWTFLIGPRFMYLEENVGIATLFDPTINSIIETNITTENPLIGAQVGLEHRRPLTRNAFFVGGVKAGGYANNSLNQTITEASVGGVSLGSTTLVDQRQAGGAFVGEIAARIHWDIAPGTVSVYAGYEGTWMDAVALAPPQLLSRLIPNQPQVHTASTPYIQGLVLGGMIRF